VKVTEQFRDAQALATFANLKEAEVQGFRANYPDFAPESWWDSDQPMEMVQDKALTKRWRFAQALLQGSWGRFEIRDVVWLVVNVFDTNLSDLRHPSLPPKVMAGVHDIVGLGEYGFHRGVLYLQEQPWRAKRCENCQEYIVVGSAKTKYCVRDECGNNIREINHRKAKLRWYHRNKDKWKANSRRLRKKQTKHGRK
jgi:hypothetical protein